MIYIAPNPKLAATFRSDMPAFMTKHGFVATSDPDPNTSATHYKMTGSMTSYCYIGSFGTSRDLLVKVTESRLSDGQVEFWGSMQFSYSLRDSGEDVGRFRQQVWDFTKAFEKLADTYDDRAIHAAGPSQPPESESR